MSIEIKTNPIVTPNDQPIPPTNPFLKISNFESDTLNNNRKSICEEIINCGPGGIRVHKIKTLVSTIESTRYASEASGPGGIRTPNPLTASQVL